MDPREEALERAVSKSSELLVEEGTRSARNTRSSGVIVRYQTVHTGNLKQKCGQYPVTLYPKAPFYNIIIIHL